MGLVNQKSPHYYADMRSIIEDNSSSRTKATIKTVNQLRGLFYGYMQWKVHLVFKKEQENGHGQSYRKSDIDSKNKEKDMTQRKMLLSFDCSTDRQVR